ncbi:hypothetical protein BH09ACT2_BH09ACT2_08430 [soil metagenome]
MFTTKKTVTIVALALAGALSIGAVASAQAQSGPAGRAEDRTPATSVSPAPVTDDNGLRGNGTADDSQIPATPGTTPAPVPSSGLPTDADHPQGDDSMGRVDDADEAGEGVGDDVGEDSHSGAADDGAGHDIGDDHGAASGHDSGHDSGNDASHDATHTGSRH